MTAGLEMIGEAPVTLERRGWSAPEVDCAPKIAALASLSQLEAPTPVARVAYHSHGNLLVIAGREAERARRAAERLTPDLHVTVVAEGAINVASPVAAWSAEVVSLTGFLGGFTAAIAGLKPGALSPARFDLVLDFSARPLFAMRQPPQGYFRAPADDGALDAVLVELREAVGEFEKPRYFAYRENICAHSRSQVVGCTQCIEVCSTGAIASEGDHVKVDPHLCMGCGACATVCPSGAMSYQYPRVSERGGQMKLLLRAYREAGGQDACIVFHNGSDGRALLVAAASCDRGLPARALPLETWHVGAIGLDLLLTAVAFGASQVVVIAAGPEDNVYREALRSQMAIGNTILGALGYGGTHFALIEAHDAVALDQAFARLQPAAIPGIPAAFSISDDKRTAIEFALDHLRKYAPRVVDEIELEEGAPFGAVQVDRKACTMCMACVGACPESALMDGVDQPLLKFVERNCVQCGLCEASCPEDAITLAPRLTFGPAVREPRVLNEAQPFLCVSCGKPFGTRQMVDAMMGRLAGHSMFSESGALRRLQMCADCRVVDMMSRKDEMSVLKPGAES